MDAVLASSLGIAAAGAVMLAILYKNPHTRPLTASGYTAMAVTLALLTAVGMAGGVVAASKASSSVVVDAMRGVVEGAYKARAWPPAGVARVNTTTAPTLLARKSIAALERAEEAVGRGLGAGGCRLESGAYALVEAAPQGAPGGAGVAVVIDPHAEAGHVTVTGAGGPLTAGLEALLRGEGLLVARNASPKGLLGRLAGSCGGGLAECLTTGLNPIITPPIPGAPGGAEAVSETFVPVSTSIIVGPGDAERVFEALAGLARGFNSTSMSVVIESLIIADIPDTCYYNTSPTSAWRYTRNILWEAAPAGFRAYMTPEVSRRLAIVTGAGLEAIMGSSLALALFAAIILAASPPLADAGALSIAGPASQLRLRGASRGAIARHLALLTTASTLLGLGAGLAGLEALEGGVGRLGAASSLAVGAVAALLAFRAAGRLVGEVRLEAAARGSLLAARPPAPPRRVGWLGWLSLALGLYHAVRGYLGFASLRYLEQHGASLPAAAQALLGVWGFVEVITAPFAPALLAYGTARILAWRVDSIVASRLTRRILGETAALARGLARLASARAAALVVLLVFASSLLTGLGASAGLVSYMERAAASTALSPGGIALKAPEPRNASATVGGANSSLSTYDVEGLLEEAGRLCPEGVVAVAAPLYVGGVLVNITGGFNSSVAGEMRLAGALYGGGPSLVLLAFKSDEGAYRILTAPGFRVERADLNAPGHAVYPEAELGRSVLSPGWVPYALTPRGEPVEVRLDSVASVPAVPASRLIRWYTGATGSPPEIPAGLVAAGSWAFNALPKTLAYPRASTARPVVVVYTLNPSAPCLAALERAGWRVYTPQDLESLPEFRSEARVAADLHPLHFLAVAAGASSALAVVAALLVAVDSEREAASFMALLRLRGARPRVALRVSAALWGLLVAVAVVVGVAAGLGAVASTATALPTSQGVPVYEATFRLEDGAPVRALFTIPPRGALGFGLGSIVYPLALGAAVAAPLILALLRVFRGVARERLAGWL